MEHFGRPNQEGARRVGAAHSLIEALSAEAVVDKADLLSRLEAFIQGHRLREGSRLPNERVLATASGLSRASVRYALDRLVQSGVLSRHVGRGTFVLSASASHRSAAHTMTPAEILEFRIAVEPSMVGLIIMKATDRQLAEVRDFVGTCRTANTWQECERFDSTFHGMLFGLTGNSLFTECQKTIAEARRNNSWQKYKELNFSPEKWAEYQADHERIIASLLNRDIRMAETHLRNHLVGVRARFAPGPGAS